MADESALIALIADTARCGVLRKLVLSQPAPDAPAPKQSGKLCRTKNGDALIMESAFDGGRVSQKITPLSSLTEELAALLPLYRQVNLLTSLGDAERRLSKKGSMLMTGERKIRAAMTKEDGGFLSFALPIDREKKHLLTGDEPFLFALGITDKTGRVHDKKQGKFRQINRFLEYVEECYATLPSEGKLQIADLCCGKSYLSFAVYHYLSSVKKREVEMVCVDRRQDIIDDCRDIARECGFSGMHFLADDVRYAPVGKPDAVVSLHACDVATDVVLSRAAELGAPLILSTPCCHRTLKDNLSCPPLSFVTDHPQLTAKLAEAMTDGLRLLFLESCGYRVRASELTDPENTPKNTILIAEKKPSFSKSAEEKAKKKYRDTLSFLGLTGERYWEDV